MAKESLYLAPKPSTREPDENGLSEPSSGERSTGRKATLFLMLSLVVFTFAFAWRLPHCNNEIFLVDSANYVRAANNGFWSQYTGSDGMSVIEFLRLRRAGGSFRQHPWGALSDAGDGAALRHFHSPVSFYLYALTQRFGGRPSANRIATAVISSATIALLFSMALLEGVPPAVAVIGALVLSLSPPLITAGTDMTPHPMFSIAALAAIASFALYWTERRRVWLTAWVITTAVAIATLEFATLLIATFAIMIGIIFWQARGAGHHSRNIKRVTVAIVGVIACLFALWPAGFFKGGYALSYGTLLFQGVFRQREKRDFLTTIVRLGSGHLWVGLLFVVLLGIGVYSACRSRRYLLMVTVAVYALLMFFEGKGNGFSNPTYASHFIYAIVLLTMLSVRCLLKTGTRGGQFAAAASICIMATQATLYCYLTVRAQPEQWTQEPSRVAAAISSLKTTYEPGVTFVVNNYAEPMTTYAPTFHFVSTIDGGTLTAQPWENVGPHYLLIYTKSLTEPLPNICLRTLSEDFRVSCDKLVAIADR